MYYIACQHCSMTRCAWLGVYRGPRPMMCRLRQGVAAAATVCSMAFWLRARRPCGMDVIYRATAVVITLEAIGAWTLVVPITVAGVLGALLCSQTPQIGRLRCQLWSWAHLGLF